MGTRALGCSHLNPSSTLFEKILYSSLGTAQKSTVPQLGTLASSPLSFPSIELATFLQEALPGFPFQAGMVGVCALLGLFWTESLFTLLL